jgi:hypothetical protein
MGQRDSRSLCREYVRLCHSTVKHRPPADDDVGGMRPRLGGAAPPRAASSAGRGLRPAPVPANETGAVGAAMYCQPYRILTGNDSFFKGPLGGVVS